MGMVTMKIISIIAASLFFTCHENNKELQAAQTDAPISACEEPTVADSGELRQLAERIFIAYVNGAIKNYEVGLMVCGKEFNYHFTGIKSDANFGNHWRVRIDTGDMEITIFPGK